MRPPMIRTNDASFHEVEKAAMKCLYDSPYRALRRISCECKDGVLFLKGRLFRFHETQMAQETVAKVKGVIQVVNQINVVDWASHVSVWYFPTT